VEVNGVCNVFTKRKKVITNQTIQLYIVWNITISFILSLSVYLGSICSICKVHSQHLVSWRSARWRKFFSFPKKTHSNDWNILSPVQLW
jgi:hypothetical protein